MGQTEHGLTDLGARVAQRADEAMRAAPRLDPERGRQRFLALFEPRAHRRRSAKSRAALLAALVLGAIALVLVVRSRPLQLAVGVGEPAVVGAWIAAPPDGDLPIRFSDGSVLHLRAGARARVNAVSADGAEIALESGELDADIVHRPGARWLVQVGPFSIRVVGTRFHVRWDARTDELGVALHEGAITLTGPVIGEAHALIAGQRVTVSLATGAARVEAIDDRSAGLAREAASEPPEPASSLSAPLPTPSASPSGSFSGSEPPPPSRRPTASTPPLTPSWRELAHRSKYHEALAAAEAVGFDAICRAAAAADLRLLGDVARLAGDGARASQAYLAIRQRFGQTPAASEAAFLLGRVAQDAASDHAHAAKWLTTYLGEHPSGPLAAEALGRLIEAEDRRGDHAAARRAATRYLAAYPDGWHASYARSVLAKGAGQAP